MAELYIFSQDDKLLTILSESTGLTSAPFRDELNNVASEPFVFTIDAEVEKAKHVKEENRVVFKDREGYLREYVIKEIDDVNGIDGPETQATCIPSFLEELGNSIIDDRRFIDKKAQEALNVALARSRWTGVVEVDLGLATTNFYYISSVEAIWKILEVWGGDFKDVVYLSPDKTHISQREVRIKRRLGADRGLRFEVDHNINEIQRTILSYPVTALYGRGASLEIEDEQGNHTGGYTRYIDFADVEWKKSKGDPIDKPKGQKWVGDPVALQKYGYKKDGQLLHLEGIFSNQDYDDPKKLLQATWEHLQKAQHPEINYRLSVDLLDKKAELGDTAVAIDREFARPIEIQTRIIAIEYDLLDIEGTAVVEMGQFLALDDDRLDRVVDAIEKNRGNWDQADKPINKNKYPDKKPTRPLNVRAEGGIETIQLYWDYADEIFIKHYEVYGSQVKDFVPDAQHLLWRGQVSAFAHTVGTDQKWYYRIRAVNYHDRASDWSVQVEASTHRVISDDILFGEDLAARLRELSEISDIVADGTVGWDKISEQAKNLIEYDYKQYTDAEIQATRDYLTNRLNDEIGDVNGNITNLQSTATDLLNRVDDTENILSQHDGKFTSIETDINTIEGRLSASITNVERINNTVSSHSATLIAQADLINAKVDNLTYQRDKNGILSDIQSNTADIKLLSNEIDLRVTKEEFNNLQVGTRNLIFNSDFTDASNYGFWVPVGDLYFNENSPFTYEGFNKEFLRVAVPADVVGSNRRIRSRYNVNLIEAQEYTLSFIATTSDWLDSNFNYTAILRSNGTFATGGNLSSRITKKAIGRAVINGFNKTIYRYSVTFTFNDETSDNYSIMIGTKQTNDSGAYFIITEPMLAQGNQVVPWQPAYEDAVDRISKSEASINVLSDAISLKADASELINYVDKQVYNNKMGQLDVSINGISGRVTNAESVINRHTGEIESARSQIANLDVKADGISANVSDLSSDLTTAKSNIASLDIKANGIISTVNSIRIGGRNLLRWSDFTDAKNYNEWVAIGDLSLGNNPVSYEGFNKQFLRVAVPADVVGSNRRIRSRYNVNLIEDQEYTLSFVAASSDFVSSDFNYTGILRPNGTFNRLLNLERKKIGEAVIGGFNKSIYKYWSTFTSTYETGNNYALMIGTKQTNESGAYFIITEPMLENGTMVTDWDINPEDTNQRMSIAESSITQLEDDITLKVDRDNVVSQINVNPEGIRLDSRLIVLDGLSIIREGVIGTAAIANAAITRAKLGTAVVGTAQIQDAAITNAKIHSVNADKVNATSLSTISANLGTVTAGILRSGNYNFDLNLNTGFWQIQNLELKVGSGADIQLLNANNRIYYERVDGTTTRTAGIGVGNAFNNRYPVAWVGVTGTSRLNFDPRDENYFSGLIVNTRARTVEDGIGNSIVGTVFDIRDQAVSFTRGFRADLTGSVMSFRPISAGSNTYHLGESNNKWDRLYVKEIQTNQDFTIYSDYNRDPSRISSGWLIETSYLGDGTGIKIRGINGGEYNYVLGENTEARRIHSIFLRNNPIVNSDERLKEDIEDLPLGLDFINAIEPKTFRMRLRQADINAGVSRNKKQFGIIAQQVMSTMQGFGLDVHDHNIISGHDSDSLSFQYEQLIPALIKSDQELDLKIESVKDDVEWLKLENQYLRQKIELLEEKVA